MATEANVVATQENEYFATYPGGYRVTSNCKITDGDLQGEFTDYSLITDEKQGIAWYKSGLQKLVVNGCSYETVGIRGKENEPSKIICAAYGNILIEAQDGDIILKGRNIRFDASAELTMNGSEQIYIGKTPILNLDASNTNILGTKNLSLGGNFIEVSGGSSVDVGTQTDKLQGGFLGALIGAFDRFKDFL